MLLPICPVCGEKLSCEKPAWRCENGHSFDVARQGYVNLLTVDKKHSLHPGDTREMVLARKAFLDAGYYAPIADLLGQILQEESPKNVLDVGCGEGYYLTTAAPQSAEVWGVDISKEAVRCAAVRNKNAHWLVATASHLPFGEGSFDCLTAMFSLTEAKEFFRVLKPGGLFVSVTAHPEHLLGLKKIIYPEILEKPGKEAPRYPGFTLENSRELTVPFALTSREMVGNLLTMTPHYWRIDREGALRLAGTEYLQDTARVVFRLYRREGETNAQ